MQARDAGPKYVPLSERLQTKTRRKLTNAHDVAVACRDIRDEPVENFVMFSMNVRHSVIARHVVARGCLTGVEVHPRDAFRQAILDGAAAVIFAHNHPSGDSTPSPDDVGLTRRLREVGQLVGIVVLDHLVLAEDGFTSLAERGWC
jgi:DNA repair protein RadC